MNHNAMCACGDCIQARTQFVAAPAPPPPAHLANHASTFVAGTRVLVRPVEVAEYSADDGASWHRDAATSVALLTRRAEDVRASALLRQLDGIDLAARLTLVRDVIDTIVSDVGESVERGKHTVNVMLLRRLIECLDLALRGPDGLRLE